MTSSAPLRKISRTARDAGDERIMLIELLFFAYRDFVAEADQALATYGFGRAHHRVLHFVNRKPGMTVADLLTILGITKQSLARVLRDLIDGGFVQQQPGEEDRRQRLLRLTVHGKALADQLLTVQCARVERALNHAQVVEIDTIRQFLTGLIEPKFRPIAAGMISNVIAGD